MREWKYWHRPAGIGNAGLEISGVKDSSAQHAILVFYALMTAVRECLK